MRKFLAALLIAALGLTLAGTASAQIEWSTLEGKWSITNQGGPQGPTAIWNRDTLYNVIAAGQTDTTSRFALEHIAPVWRVATAATIADTALVGYLVFDQDSLGVTGPTVSSITVKIDGSMGGFGNSLVSGWTVVDSVVANVIGGAGPVVVPLRATGSPMSGPVITTQPYNREYKIMAFKYLRARITSVTGVMSAARFYIRYPKNVSGQGSRYQ